MPLGAIAFKLKLGPGRKRVHAYVRFRGADLPHIVGVDGEGGVRRADGRSGHLSHGPYVNLTPGIYTAGFYVRREDTSDLGEIDVDICCEHGARELGRKSFAADEICTSIAGLLRVDFQLDSNAKACEARLHVPEGFMVEIRELVIFRRSLAGWGIQ